MTERPPIATWRKVIAVVLLIFLAPFTLVVLGSILLAVMAF
jgi:hypothetical protein